MNPDGSIPDDNPAINGVRSHIFTYGHRNAQGIAVGPSGDLYISEHGDKSDDELNRLQAGGNYGWPYVSGYNDDKAYQFVNWSAAENCEDLTFNNIAPPPPGVPVMNESEFEAAKLCAAGPYVLRWSRTTTILPSLDVITFAGHPLHHQVCASIN